MQERDVVRLYAGIVSAAAGRGDLDVAVADFHRLARDTPGLPVLAAALVEAIVRSGQPVRPSLARAVRDLLRVAQTDPPTGTQWARTRGAAEVTAIVQEVLDDDAADVGAALARLDEIGRDSGDDPVLRPLLESARWGMRVARAGQEGDSAAIAGLPADVDRFLAGLPEADRHGPTGRMLARGAGLMAAHERGENVLPDLLEMLSAFQASCPDDSLRDVAGQAADTLRPLAAMMSGDDVPAGVAPVSPDGDPLRHAVAGQAALDIGRERDPARVAAGIGHLRRALDLAGPGHSQRVFHLVGLAAGLFRRSELTNDAADLREARTLLEEARELAGGPRHPQWQMLNEMLSDAGRLLASGPDSHRAGIEGLRANAWKALVQPDLRGVTIAVRDAASAAVDVARGCL
ncbi:hypothetical protein, partial [Actinoplanes sp. NPDC026623]|uniref:hypothetical protein n=1 Tax=Actinoplanes sp. NPDC026623 TaxID=3155610 RepID=UPI0033CCA008